VKRLITLTVLVAMGCRAPETEDVITLPGTLTTFRLARLPGGSGIAPFRIAPYEVTWAEFDRFLLAEKWIDEVGDMVRWSLREDEVRPGLREHDRPAVGIAWHSAVAYCDWLSRNTGYYFRLPTEPEWEYAMRGGKEIPAVLDEVAWHRGNSGWRSHPPGGKNPNGFGLHDMLGNAWEYLLEWQEPPSFGPVLRGGSWETPASDLASRKQPIPEDWNTADFIRPHSLGWLASFSPSAGMRIMAVAGPDDLEERQRYHARLEVRIIEAKHGPRLKIGAGTFHYYKVEAEVRNAGDRAVDDLEIEIHALTPTGKPHRKDQTVESGSFGRPTWMKVWPALSSSAHRGDAARPLAPGEKRRFSVRVPESIDDEDEVDPGKFGAQVTNLRFTQD